VIELYLEQAVTACQRLTPEPLAAAWVVGSLATDDFSTAASDIDLVVVAPARLPEGTKKGLAQALDHCVLACPAHGLDLIIYRMAVLEGVPRAPEYEFSISTGIEWETHVSFGGPYPGGLIDLATSRQIGRSLLGPHPREVVGQIPEQWVVEELLASLRWHLDKVHHPFHDPCGSNAVLNACRALHYLAAGNLVSKSAGAEWLLSTRSVPIAAEALERRLRPSSARLDHTQVISFLRDAIAEFESGTG
jgi:predicted nucleotidyltransferase